MSACGKSPFCLKTISTFIPSQTSFADVCTCVLVALPSFDAGNQLPHHTAHKRLQKLVYMIWWKISYQITVQIWKWKKPISSAINWASILASVALWLISRSASRIAGLVSNHLHAVPFFLTPLLQCNGNTVFPTVVDQQRNCKGLAYNFTVMA